MSYYQNDTNIKRIRAVQLEHETLYALGVLGVLVTSQLAKWTNNDSHAAVVVQQRVVKRLTERGLIMSKQDRMKRNLYYLTKPGAALLRELKPEGAWHHGHDYGGTLGPEIQTQIFERALKEKREGHEVLATAGMRAYGIPLISRADLLVMTPTENVAIRISRKGDSKWALC